MAESVTAHPSAGHLLRPALGAEPNFHWANEFEPGRWALVVDSDPLARAQLRHALAALGYEVVEAPDVTRGREALRCHGGRPGVMILDSSTRHAIGLVRGVSPGHEIPVIVSGRRGSGFVRYLGVEADGFLAKPLVLAKVISEIRATARRTPAQRLAIRRARRTLSESPVLRAV